MASENDSTTTPGEAPDLDTPSVDAVPTEASAADAPAADAPAAKGKKTAKRAPRKSARKAAATPPGDETADTGGDATAATDDGGGAALDDELAAPARKKPAKKAAAKRASRSRPRTPAAEPETAAEGSTAEETAAAPTEAVAEPPAAPDAPPAAADDEADDTDDAVADEEPGAPAAAAAPSFGLLFQAPEPTTVRRRRATSPSQAPSERAATTPDAGDAVPVASAGSGAAGAADQQAPGDADRVTERGAGTNGPGGDQGGDDTEGEGGSRRRRRGGRGRRGRAQSDDDQAAADGTPDATAEKDGADRGATGDDGDGADGSDDADAGSTRRRRRRRRGAGSGESDDPPGTVTRTREPRAPRDEPTAVKGSTRLEAKKQRRREGREAGRRRTIITEAEFLSRRESVDRAMVVRGRGDRTQIGVLEDGVLVEHYVSRETTASMAGNIYLGRVQNVLPSMEAAFVDIGRGRNAVLYAGEVNWDAAGLEGGHARRIENALTSGDTVLVQVTKDPIGHKGARLTSQISLPGRYVVYVPEGSMTGISRKLPDTERARLKGILKEVVPDSAGVIVRTAAEGASEEELTADVQRLTSAWEKIQKKAETAAARKAGSGGAPVLLHGEPDLTVRVIRDVFTEDFSSLVVSGEKAWGEVSDYIDDVAPDLAARVTRWTSQDDVFAEHRIDEQIAKAMDRKVWLPSGGSLVIDRTEAMTVVDVNTGKFIGAGGNLEETVTKNNIEAAEEIVRQLRLRDIGGIIVIDFIDMVLESNRDLVVRRLLECLGRDRTKHQVAEVTSLGLVQMTRKRVGSGLIEVFSEPCEHCKGSGIVVQTEPVDRGDTSEPSSSGGSRSGRGRRAGGSGSGSGGNGSGSNGSGSHGRSGDEPARTPSGPTAAQIAAAAHAAALRKADSDAVAGGTASRESVADAVAEAVVEAVVGAGAEVPADEAPAAKDPTQSAEEPMPTAAEPSSEAPEPAPAGDGASPATSEPPSVAAEATASQASPAASEATASQASPAASETGPDPVEAPPAPRARRRRGRVVAPAGPPRAVTDQSGAPASGEATAG